MLRPPPRPTGATSRPGLRLTLGPVRIDVHAADPEVLIWLAEFLEPAFAAQPLASLPQSADEADHVVVLEESLSDPESILRAGSTAAREEWDVFTKDGSFTCLPGWEDASGQRWAHDSRRKVVHHSDADSRVVRVIDLGSRRTRLTLMRVVRELATTALLRATQLPVHGAAFVHEGRGIVACGPKRSGKTSLLLHAMQCGASFLSNDRVFVDLEDPIRARGMPTIVSIREKSLAFFGKLSRTLEQSPFDRIRTIEECEREGVLAQMPVDSNVLRATISPAQLCKATEAQMVASAELEMLLFPEIDPAADGIALEPLSPTQAGEMMSQSLLKPSHPTRSSQFFCPREMREEIAVEEENRRCSRLTGRVASYRCRLGPEAFQADLGRALKTSSQAIQ